MNNARRQRIRDISSKIDVMIASVEQVLDEENEARENMPESLADSERYSQSEECSSALEAAIDSLNEANDSLGEIV